MIVIAICECNNIIHNLNIFQIQLKLCERVTIRVVSVVCYRFYILDRDLETNVHLNDFSAHRVEGGK